MAPQSGEVLRPPGFMECRACAIQSGSPSLCESCLHNRALIETLVKENVALRSSGVVRSWGSQPGEGKQVKPIVPSNPGDYLTQWHELFPPAAVAQAKDYVTTEDRLAALEERLAQVESTLSSL